MKICSNPFSVVYHYRQVQFLTCLQGGDCQNQYIKNTLTDCESMLQHLEQVERERLTDQWTLDMNNKL